ncbi:MAG TPA: ATP-binding protein, partial [Polyangiaceae bacterium]|nr:ATP-binding protein [Polyangiaceae bacterium]
MITLKAVEIVGVSDRGDFRGGLEFGPGLNILSAPNAYGKSLAVTAIPWCLGLEPMFGLSNNDPSRFPAAVRDVFEVAQGDEAHVVSSEARLTLQRDDGATVTLVRSIKSGQPEFVDAIEPNADGSQRVSRLLARRDTMA